MLEEQTVLITILKEVIANYDLKIKKLINDNNSILLVNKGILDDFRNDIEVITEIDLKIVNAIFEELNDNSEEKDKILKYLSLIKKLLLLNKEKKTTYKITEEQLHYVELFFEKVDCLERQNHQTHLDNLKKITKMSAIRSKYTELLEQLKDTNNKNFISDLNLIGILLNECELEEKVKRNVLINIMKYNQKINLSNCQ